ncbi:MAG: formylglycine-generating enzyme family protein [Fuerstiella sp.]
MRISLFVLLLFTITGCGSGSPDAGTVREHMTSDQLALSDPVTNSVGMVLVPIPAGEFQMGTPRPKPDKLKKERPQADKAEMPQHLVRITKPFYISSCEVTQEQYEKVMVARPWQGKPLVEEGPTYPATYVSWKDAVEFCVNLSELENTDYRLPTEAEWEYACRAGTNAAFSFGDEWGELIDHAWFDQNAYKAKQQYAHGVGQKLPNPWGLYDTHGNAWEWCQDWYAPYGKKKEDSDPTGPEKGQFRVWRGGGFSDSAVNARSATRLSYSRHNYRPEFMSGFRVVRTFDAK